jgi:hypothetical protein
MKYLLFVLLIFSAGPVLAQASFVDLEVYCQEIEREVDDETGEVRLYSPYDNPIYFKKYMSGGKEAYRMTINVIGPAANTGKGVIVNLGRSYTINKQDVVTEVYQNADGQYVHYVTFTLNKNDVSMLKNYIIRDYTVYMYSGGESENNVKYQGYMHCLSKK